MDINYIEMFTIIVACRIWDAGGLVREWFSSETLVRLRTNGRGQHQFGFKL